MTHFGFHDNRFSVFKVAQIIFLQKPLTKDIAQMALFLVINESVTDKIALFTYLQSNLNGNVGWE